MYFSAMAIALWVWKQSVKMGSAGGGIFLEEHKICEAMQENISKSTGQFCLSA
jgi:hypothetical protein